MITCYLNYIVDPKKLSEFEDKSLLIVDDDNPFRQRLARAMEKNGFLVTQAEGVKVGIESVKSKKPAFAVVDLRLNDGNGIEVVKEIQKNKLIKFLEDAKKAGKEVYGLGASTKGNVLLQYYGINEDLLPAIGDVNEDKFGKFTPGSLIPIISEADVLKRKPDYLVVLPWHFRDFFLSNRKMTGLTLVFPLPELTVVKL